MQIIELKKKYRNTFVSNRNKDFFSQLISSGKKISPQKKTFNRGRMQSNIILNGRKTNLVLSGFDDYVYEYEFGSWLSKKFKKVTTAVKKVVKKVAVVAKKVGKVAVKVGKVALKVAPIALALIPGIGPQLAAGITAITSKASEMMDAKDQQKAQEKADAQYQQDLLAQQAAQAEYDKGILEQQVAASAATLPAGSAATSLIPGLTPTPLIQQQMYEQQQQTYIISSSRHIISRGCNRFSSSMRLRQRKRRRRRRQFQRRVQIKKYYYTPE